MQLEEITLAAFAASNTLRVLAYLPQIHKAVVDENGASAISRTTWSLFLVAHLSTIAYALVNRSDPWLAACFTANALCCLTILAIAWWRGRRRTSGVRHQLPISHLDTPQAHSHKTRQARRVREEHGNFSRAVLVH